MDEGPYFFNLAGLYLREWAARFNPDKEDLSWAPIWIRMYSLPEEYWDEESLRDIGNGLGEFIKAAEEMKMPKYTSYACICIFMCLDKALPDSVCLSHDGYEWNQALDYEHVPFRYCKFHALGHLFRDCPLNAKPQTANPSDMQNQEGFTKVSNRKRLHRKRSNGKTPLLETSSLPTTSNIFEILANTSKDPLHSISKLQPPSAPINPRPLDPLPLLIIWKRTLGLLNNPERS